MWRGGGGRTRYVIAYDIRDERRRRKVVTCLLDHGFRIQYSVFEADLSRRQMEKVRKALAALLAPNDSLVCIPLCASCRDRVERIGTTPDPFSDDDLFFV